jgi:alkylation response protein AidB-like acyl-CoA dehydrogenase
LCNTAMQIMGHYGSLQMDSRWVKAEGMFERYGRVAASGAIGGGSSEVMRTILAARGLGMPRGS